ncbi:MAG: hypothetical protein Kow0099_11500 [Candidatus Abyssubacteria bacterium]
MKRQAQFFLVALMVLCFPALAFADGKVFKGRDNSAFIAATENEQCAAISHDGAVQKMVISVAFEAEENDNGLWIFPVPGAPEQVEVDLIDSFPAFTGADPREEARGRLKEFGVLMRLPLIVPAFLELSHRASMPAGRFEEYKEVEKWGIRARSATAVSI